jgi:D-alanine-D-alanine ligase-like ATP-grasp enzyme
MKPPGKTRQSSRLKIGVLYGGRSGEHDVSLCSAASVTAALDPKKYDIVAVGIDRDGRWYVQDRPVIVADKAFAAFWPCRKRGRGSSIILKREAGSSFTTSQAAKKSPSM